MDAQTLPLPNPGDWLTIAGAMRRLHVSRRTVERMVHDGRLTGYYLEGSPRRVASAVLWRAEVMALAEALARVRSQPRLAINR
jgi:excisionase family DNA binding protein